MTYAVADKSCDGTFSLRCLKQKQFVDGIGYLLQEIYGIENKNMERAKVSLLLSLSLLIQGAYRSWNVMEIKIKIFQAWKVLESDLVHGRSWKIN